VTGACAYDYVEGFGSSKVVADGADSAKTLYQNGSFPVGTTLYKTLKTAEFNNMKAGLSHVHIIIELNGNFTVSFNSGYWFYCYFLH
jgi:hypothetical protein